MEGAVFFNQYSFLLVALTVLLGTTFWVYSSAWQLWRLGVLAALIVVLGVIAVVSQRTATKESMPAAFQENKIVLVEYYSDF